MTSIEPAGADQCAWSFCVFCWGDPRISATRKPSPKVGYLYHVCRTCAEERGINQYDRAQVDAAITRGKNDRYRQRDRERAAAKRDASR